MKVFFVFIVLIGSAIALPKVDQKPDERVIGATVAATLGQIPWVAGVMYNKFFICAGALIGPSWIITSAECVYLYKAPPAVGLLSVQLGNLLPTFVAATDHAVKVVMEHPDFIPGGPSGIMHHRNIALLELITPVVETPTVHHIALPAIGQIPIGHHTDVSLSGWGLVYNTLDKTLMYVDLQTMSIDACIDAITGNPSIEHDYNVCTAGFSSTSGLPSGACEMDHGGPLVWIYLLKPLLVGVVSQGDCTSGTPRIPTIYSSTFGHNREWIKLGSGI